MASTSVTPMSAAQLQPHVFDNRIERAKFTREEALSLLHSLGIERVD